MRLFIIFFGITIFLTIGIPVQAAFQLPFEDGKTLNFSQNWHQHGAFYNKNSSYGWTSGANYAVDMQVASSNNVIAPEDGVVKHIEFCSTSANMVVEFNNYEMQFYHFDKNNISVSVNSTVTKGQTLGQLYWTSFIDSCGNSGGQHLHMRFHTSQGDSDAYRLFISGYIFDQYDGTSGAQGADKCIMHRNGTDYCLAGYGTSTFTANEATDLYVSNKTLQAGEVNGATSVVIQPDTYITPISGGEVKIITGD